MKCKQRLALLVLILLLVLCALFKPNTGYEGAKIEALKERFGDEDMWER